MQTINLLFRDPKFLIPYAKGCEYLADGFFQKLEQLFFGEEGRCVALEIYAPEVAARVKEIAQNILDHTRTQVSKTLKGYQLTDPEGCAVPLDALIALVRPTFANEQETLNRETDLWQHLRGDKIDATAKFPSVTIDEKVNDETWKELLFYQHPEVIEHFINMTDLSLYRINDSFRVSTGGSRGIVGAFSGAALNKLKKAHEAIHKESQSLKVEVSQEAPCLCFPTEIFPKLSQQSKIIACKETMGKAYSQIEGATATAKKFLAALHNETDICSKKPFDITQGEHLLSELNEIVELFFESLNLQAENEETELKFVFGIAEQLQEKQRTRRRSHSSPVATLHKPTISKLNASTALKAAVPTRDKIEALGSAAENYSIQLVNAVATAQLIPKELTFVYNALQSYSQMKKYTNRLSNSNGSPVKHSESSSLQSASAAKTKILGQLFEWSAIFGRISTILQHEIDTFEEIAQEEAAQRAVKSKQREAQKKLSTSNLQ